MNILNLKKSFIKLLIITIVFNIFITFSSAEFIEIYEENWSEKLSKGVTYEKILRFTDKGWLHLNVLRVDLDDRYTSLDVLTSNRGISDRDTLTGLAFKNESAEKILGATNGHFYDSRLFTTIGPIVRDGQLITSSKNSPDFATFNIDQDGNPFIDYWTTNNQRIINLKNQALLNIGYKNKSYINSSVILLDRHWGDFSFGVEKNENIVEMVIVKDKVKEIRNNLEAVHIPENGYIVAATGSLKDYIINNFSINDRVRVEEASEPDFENMALSVGGGAVILKDGLIPHEFSLSIPGRHPRTALGISRDNKEIIMLTIDGRSTSYPGVSQKELAELLIELGAYNAINLDGGGSTEMIVRPLGEKDLSIVNEPSGGFERRIMNGLAVLNSSRPKSSLKGLKVESSDTNIFVNTSREFELKGYDVNYNPVEVNPTKAKWRVDGVEGRFIKNRFIPSSSGKGTITASYKGETASIDIRVLDNPIKLEISPSKIYAETKHQIPISVTAADDEGYTARIHSDDLFWSIPDGIGEIENNTFIASQNINSDLLMASINGVNAYAQVTTGYLKIILDDFERINGSFLAYPNEVTGSFKLSSREKSGKSSGKLSYDFENAPDTKAAYILFNNGGIHLKERPEKLGLWVYGNKGNSHWLRGKVTDSAGNTFNLTFDRYVDWDGWKFVEANIPSSAAAPLKLERIYLVETEPCYQDSGYIYVDDLTAFYKSKINKEIPKDTRINFDKRNIYADLKSENSFRFLAHGSVGNINTLLDNLAVNKLSSISEDMDLSIFTNHVDSKLTEKLSDSYSVISSGYSHTELKNSSFIKLDNRNGGIRATDYNQWIWLLDLLDKIDSDSVFVTLPSDLKFKDELEEELFFDTFKKLKEEKGIDVWIFAGEHDKDSEIQTMDGIRIVKLKSYPAQNTIDIYNDLKYMVFTVNDGYVTYEIKNIFEKPVEN